MTSSLKKKTSKFQPRKKRAPAIWTQAFPAQHSAIHPERQEAGGIKMRGASEKVRMGIYFPIAELYKAHNSWCEACKIITPISPVESDLQEINLTDDVHHRRGRSGLLLFDIRHWLAVCRTCHDWIRDNPKKARELGLDFTH